MNLNESFLGTNPKKYLSAAGRVSSVGRSVLPRPSVDKEHRMLQLTVI